MNKNGFNDNWKQEPKKAKDWWSDLTDEPMDKVASQRSKFVTLIQEKYGYTRDKAEKVFDQRMAEYATP